MNRLRSSAALWLIVVGVAQAQSLPSGRIRLKTHQQTFNLRGDFALSDGKIWWRHPSGGEWKLLGGTGLPQGMAKPSGVAPTQISEIAADANCLIAVAPDRHLYDVTLHDTSNANMTWEDGFGWPYRLGKKPVFIPPEARTWTFSLIDQEGALFTEDIDGNPHQTVGVFTVWALDADGRGIRYNDPWIPPNTFEFRVGAPERGDFAIHAISASASTVFVMDRSGRMFTRHVDYDTLGANPGIRYTYQRENRGYKPDGLGAALRATLPMFFDVRSLPPEEYRAQPPIPGRFTDAVTIVQTGRGNAARELRVEGLDAEGHVGLWVKPIFDSTWTFERTDDAQFGKEIDPNLPAEPGRGPDECLTGTAAFGALPANLRPNTVPGVQLQPLYSPGGGFTSAARLEGFNLNYDPMKVFFETKDGRPLVFTVNIRPGAFPIRKGQNVKLLGEFEPAPEVQESPELKRTVQSLPGVQPHTDAWIWISDDAVRIETDPWGQPGGRHAEFKFARPRTPARCAEAVAP